MSVMSQGVLVLLVVFFGSPMTMTDGGPKAGKVARRDASKILYPGSQVAWCRRPTPVGPDLILNLRGKAIEFADADSIITSELRSGSLGKCCCCEQQ
jgi:hypothetical protein